MSTATIAKQAKVTNASGTTQSLNKLMRASAREQAALGATGIPYGIAPLGTMLRDVGLMDAQGGATSLYAATAGRPAVVVFYRGAWCPYCNIALSDYQTSLLPALVERRVRLIAISPQTADESLSMQQKNGLAFTVLSDPGNTLASHLGILTAPTSGARVAQLLLGLDLAAVNTDGATVLAMPTTLILDGNHVLRWIDVHPDYTTRSETGHILAALDSEGLRVSHDERTFR